MVCQTADSDLRAHRIALTYYNLATYLDTVYLHDGVKCSDRLKTDPSRPVNANWFHFAMWGTLTVTQNLSNQRSPQRLNSGIPGPLRRQLTPAILRARSSDGQRVGRALAWGQLAIFASVMERLTPDGTLSTDDDSEILTRVRTRLGSTRINMTVERHIAPMKLAFDYYSKARTETSNARRAWLMLGGNLLLTAAEQDLADVPVEVVLNHIPQHVGAAISWRLAKLSERFRGVPPNMAFAFLESTHPNERRVLSTIWSRLMTDQVLVMALPTETLRLGRDIPPKHREWPIFPPDLRQVPKLGPHEEGLTKDTRGALHEIVDLVRSIDRTIVKSGTRGSAAHDWRRWDERMNWALALIRSRQQDETLFWSPYTVADQWKIVYGEIPARVGDTSTLDVQAPVDPGPTGLPFGDGGP